MRKMTAYAIFTTVFSVLFLSSTVYALILNPSSMKIRSIGGIQKGAWNLWSNGRIGDYIHFKESGIYTIKIFAFGSPAGNIWPLMRFSLGDEISEQVAVSTGKNRKYLYEKRLDSGIYILTAEFLNDHIEGTEDRNLYIKKIVILPKEGTPEPVIADEKKWKESFVLRRVQNENKTLRQAVSSIEKNRKGDAALVLLDDEGRSMAGVEVKIEQIRHDFLFGCNIYMFDRFKSRKENDLYKKYFHELFNYATVGFYWTWYEKERGKPEYAYTDKVVSWCSNHGITLKGHPLLWDHPASRPKWLKGLAERDIWKKRVTDIMIRYRQKIRFWEVVNEPSHCPGIKIDESYQWAREADKDSHLIVNDYYIFKDSNPSFYSLLEKAILDNIPFDGIGIQAHEPKTMRFPLEKVKKILDKYAGLGRDMHITEFTPTSAGKPITDSHIRGKIPFPRFLWNLFRRDQEWGKDSQADVPN